jgi:S-formylglutathione hydrolase FrmB
MVRQLPIARFANDAGLAIVLPDADTSYYTNAKHRSNARWEDAVVLDLAHDVSTRFPVLSGPAHTGIAGISMGGYGAAKLALKHPGVYGFVGVISGSLDITSRPANIHLLKQRWVIWMIFGYSKEARRDEDVFQLLQQNNQLPADWFISCSKREPFYSFNERLARELKDRRVSVDFLSTNGGHDFESWSEAVTRLVNHAQGALAPRAVNLR